MDEAKKARTSKARTVTRRVNELLNAISALSMENEIIAKIENLKYTMNELGDLHDAFINLMVDGDEEERTRQDEWYYEYDKKVNQAVKEGRQFINGTIEKKYLSVINLT